MTQNANLADSVIPDATQEPTPFHPLAGNWKDDDAEAIDDYFEAADEGPIEYAGVKADKDALPRTTRVVGGAAVLTPGDARMFLPADPNRKQLDISTRTTSGDVGVIILSDTYFQTTSVLINGGAGPGLINADGKAVFIANNTVAHPTLTGYTGPVWIGFVGDAAVTCLVAVSAVTE